MRKTEVIARCLLRSQQVPDVKQGELLVADYFDQKFDLETFCRWNTALTDRHAEDIVTRQIGKVHATHIPALVEVLDFENVTTNAYKGTV